MHWMGRTEHCRISLNDSEPSPITIVYRCTGNRPRNRNLSRRSAVPSEATARLAFQNVLKRQVGKEQQLIKNSPISSHTHTPLKSYESSNYMATA